MNKTLDKYECSDVNPNIESINNLNRYVQINNIGDLEFRFEQLGQAHEPIFWATVDFECHEFSACGRTKKDCEKKIKTYIWRLISEEILVIDDRVKKQVKCDVGKSPKFHSFSTFKELLNSDVNPKRPMLLIDIENLGEKILSDQQFKSICSSYNIKVICICSRVIPETDGDTVVIRRDDLHKDSADEGIRRVIYYMVDHLGYTKIGLMTRDHFGQNLKDVLSETNQKLVTFRDIEEFNTKYFRLIQEEKNNEKNGEGKEPEVISQASSLKAKSDKQNE